nr:hypothetical protein [Tanacetum cinerariifolium]
GTLFIVELLAALWGLIRSWVKVMVFKESVTELRVCRGVGYGMVRDCRELVMELARKGERVNNGFELWVQG